MQVILIVWALDDYLGIIWKIILISFAYILWSISCFDFFVISIILMMDELIVICLINIWLTTCRYPHICCTIILKPLCCILVSFCVSLSICFISSSYCCLNNIPRLLLDLYCYMLPWDLNKLSRMATQQGTIFYHFINIYCLFQIELIIGSSTNNNTVINTLFRSRRFKLFVYLVAVFVPGVLIILVSINASTSNFNIKSLHFCLFLTLFIL